MDALDRLAGALDGGPSEWEENPLYWKFEGWDVADRTPSIVRQALEDGVDLNAPYLTQNVGSAPHLFQNGFLHSKAFFRGLIAGNQVGKTVTAFMEIQMRVSGKIPIAYRYPIGQDSGVKREINKENVLRFGRHDAKTGQFIDHDWRASQTPDWDCGTVHGCGVFPVDKIIEPGSSMRVGSNQKAIMELWFPSLTGSKRDGMGAFMLRSNIDRTRGSHGMRGSNKANYQVFMVRGCTIQLLTYESGAAKFESLRVPTYADEEPPSQDVIGAIVTHSTDWALMETPYFGITYSKDLLFPEKRSPDQETFHATTYDCPYKTEDDIRKMRAILHDKPWELGARLWGVPSEMQGKPYYDRTKISLWLQRFKLPYRLVSFEPVEAWDRIKTNDKISRLPGLLDVPVRMVDAPVDDKRATWRLYEDREDGVPYGVASDQADGAVTVQEVGDWSCAVVGRQRDVVLCPTKPVVCATLRSSLETPYFAREVLYAARYFNNALLIPESSKGAANRAFEMVADEWPWWFKDTIEKWSTRKPKENRGFCPTTNRRDALFDTLLRDWFDGYAEDQYPDIPDETILREAAAAIVGKTAGGNSSRCDHPNDGTLDMLTAYGILLFSMQAEFIRQWACHGGPEPKTRRKTFWETLNDAVTKKPREAALGETVRKLR